MPKNKAPDPPPPPSSGKYNNPVDPPFPEKNNYWSAHDGTGGVIFSIYSIDFKQETYVRNHMFY